jgi:hypothetical protein
MALEGGGQVDGYGGEAMGGLDGVVVHIRAPGNVEHFGEAVVRDVRLDVGA